jgi:hypothetical protein
VLALGSLAIASPWLLVALAALPIIWWLLRVTPPAPRRIVFPAIRLLLGLVPRDETPARTPLWLIMLRMTLAALVIFALAHPLLNPQARLASTGPIIFIVDDGWAAAHDWPLRQAALAELLSEAAREDRQVVLVTTAPLPTNEPLAPLTVVRAADARAAIQALQPKPWPVDRRAALARLTALSMPDANSAVWLSDGIADNDSEALAAYLAEREFRSRSRAGPDAAAARRWRRASNRSRGCGALAPGTRAAPLSGACQRRGRSPARSPNRDDRARRQGCRSAAGDAERAQKPDGAHRNRG